MYVNSLSQNKVKSSPKRNQFGKLSFRNHSHTQRKRQHEIRTSTFENKSVFTKYSGTQNGDWQAGLPTVQSLHLVLAARIRPVQLDCRTGIRPITQNPNPWNKFHTHGTRPRSVGLDLQNQTSRARPTELDWRNWTISTRSAGLVALDLLQQLDQQKQT